MAAKGDLKLPEATEVLESLGAALEDSKRTAKVIFPCLQEICLAFDSYGKARSRTAKSFLALLQRTDQGAAGSLVVPLVSLATDSDRTGSVISEQLVGLSGDVAQADYCEEANTLRRTIAEEIQGAAKEVLAARSLQDKAQIKHEKQIKELEAAQQAEDKARSDPTNVYQVSTTHKFEDKSKSARSALNQAISAANDTRQKVNDRLSQLEKTVQNCQNRHFAFNQKALQQTYQCFTRFLSAVKMVVAVTESSAEREAKRGEELAQMSGNLKETEGVRSGGGYSSEYFLRKLEGRIQSFGERHKAVKALKAYVSELSTQEDILAKAIQHAVSQAQLSGANSACAQAWKEVITLAEQLIACHSSRAQVFLTDISTQLRDITAEQSTMVKSLQEAAQKPLKDHTTVEDKSIRALEKAHQRAESEDLEEQKRSISEKILSSASETETTILNLIEEHSGKEAVHLETVQRLVQRLGEMEVETRKSYGTGVKAAESGVAAVDVDKDLVARPAFQMTQEPRLPLLEALPEAKVEESKSEEPQAEGALAPFSLPAGTVVLNTYSCALQKKILLQGTMFLTPAHICFRSVFNSSTIVGSNTIVVIPIKDIVRLEKRNIVFFPTGIAVIMRETEIVFGSFMKRDAVITAIEVMMDSGNSSTVPPSEGPIISEEVAIPAGISEPLVASQPCDSPEVNRDAFKDQMFHSEMLNLHPLKSEVVFAGSAVAVYQTFFAQEEFWNQYLVGCKNTNIVITPWAPGPPAEFQAESSGKWGEFSSRKMNYTHPVREKVPFMPSTCSTEEKWALYCLNNREFIVESAVTVSGVPMSDAFEVLMRWNILETNGITTVTVDYGVHFLKDTWFKGKIERSSISEATEALNDIWLPMAQEAWKSRKIVALPVVSAAVEGVDLASLADKLIPQEQLKLKLFKANVAFEGTAKEVFDCFFSTSKYWTDYLSPRGDTDIVITDWSPAPPAYYSPDNKAIWPESSTRQLTYTHPVREKMPFVPKTCACTENWTIFWVSKQKFLVDCVVLVRGVPMAESFEVKMRWSVVEEERTSVEVQYGVHFVKDSWFKSKIENSSVSEATEALNDYWVPIATKAWSEYITHRPTAQPSITASPAPIQPPLEEAKEAPKPAKPPAAFTITDLPVTKSAPQSSRDPLTWLLLALVLFLFLQVYRLSSRVALLERPLPL